MGVNQKIGEWEDLFNPYSFSETQHLTNSQISLFKRVVNTGIMVGANIPKWQYILKLSVVCHPVHLESLAHNAVQDMDS